MRQRHVLSVEYVRSILDYDPETGVFRWRERPTHPRRWNTRYVGVRAGYVSNGYVLIRIDGIGYYAAQLAWLVVKCEWPSRQVDHKNRDRSDDRFDNLRLATNGQNNANRGPQRNNSSGVRGVYFEKRRHKWRARIMVAGTSHDLGFFASVVEAKLAREQAALNLVGEFASADDRPTKYAPRNKPRV